MFKKLYSFGVPLIFIGALLLVAAANIRLAQKTFAVRVLVADEVVPIRVNDPSVMGPELLISHYNSFCLHANYTTADGVFISSFSTVDSVNHGWRYEGGDRECHDWDQNVPIFLYRDAVGADREVRFLFAK